MESRHFKWTHPLWPTTLRLPARPPRLIYLDLNHWIELSKAHSGHQDGKKHRSILDACLKAVRNGKAVFPLSESIYAEIAKITIHRQLRDLREVVEQVCQYIVVTSLTVVVTHEIEAVLDQVVGPNPMPLNTTNYLDWGVSRAFGRAGDFRVKSASGDDVTEQFRRTYPRACRQNRNKMVDYFGECECVELKYGGSASASRPFGQGLGTIETLLAWWSRQKGASSPG